METGKPPQGVGHKKHTYADVLDMIGWHLDGANEELLGLHRYRILTYDQSGTYGIHLLTHRKCDNMAWFEAKSRSRCRVSDAHGASTVNPCQYTDVANLLVDVREKLKGYIRG